MIHKVLQIENKEDLCMVQKKENNKCLEKEKLQKKFQFVDPKYKSTIIPKLINSIMYDGKKTIAEKIVYDAIDKIKN